MTRSCWICCTPRCCDAPRESDLEAVRLIDDASGSVATLLRLGSMEALTECLDSCVLLEASCDITMLGDRELRR